MTKKITYLIILIIVVGALFGGTYALLYQRWDTVLFDNNEIENAVREILNNPDRVILQSEVNNITSLNMANKGITNLNGIEYLINLRYLNLENNFISDVSPLAKLEKLESLNLRNNQITCLTSINFHLLKNLPILTSINIGHNVVRIEQGGITSVIRLKDISILEDFVNLEELDLNDNDIEDITPLSGLINLAVLDISENPIKEGSIEPLINLTNLRRLNLRETDIYSISPLSYMVNLIYLNLHSNVNIDTIEPVKDLINLRTLILRNVPVYNDIIYLNTLTKLTRLNLRNTNISDLSVLGSLMQRGALQDNPSQNILADLDIRDNPIPTAFQHGYDGYAPVRDYWHNITNIMPKTIPETPTYEIYINEFMSSNGEIADGQEESNDWIELYNKNDISINISGYYLSDNPDNLLKWKFPLNTIIPAKSFLLVYASGLNTITPSGELHTNFCLDRTGEPIILTHSDKKTIIDYVPAIYVPRDFSYGRFPDGSSDWHYFDLDNITPSGSNNNSVVSVLPQSINPDFSHSGGFYNDDFYLELFSEEGNLIYYTLDGSIPTVNSIAYTQPLHIMKEMISVDIDPIYIDNENVIVPQGFPLSLIITCPSTGSWPRWEVPREDIFKATVIRAIAINQYGQKSNVITHTYFVNEDMVNKYSFPIISISTDSLNLYDYNTGIFVPGANYDDTIEEIGTANRTGNYFMRGSEWEKPIYIEYYDENGFLRIAQNAGMRISGGASRRFPLKSLRLYARSAYDDIDYFNYQFFDDKEIDIFKTITLRAGGNNQQTSFIADVIAAHLLKPINLDVQYYKPAIIFINGEYFGIRNIRDRYDEDYLETHYGVDRNSVTILQSNGSLANGSREGIEHYRNMLDYIYNNDMSDDINYAYVNTLMDISNFIDYYASQLFYINVDWPSGNIKFWRVNTEYRPDAPYGHDGRWRWMVYDLDLSFGRVLPNHSSFERLTGVDWKTGKLFTSLLQNHSFKTQFINRFLDLLNSIFREDIVIEVINSFIELYEPEMYDYINYVNRITIDIWLNTHMENILLFSELRPLYARQQLTEYLDLNDCLSQVNIITDSNMGTVRVNSLLLNADTTGVIDPNNWTGIYLCDIPIELEAIPKEGYRFVRWEYGLTTKTNSNISLYLNGDITIRAVFQAV